MSGQQPDRVIRDSVFIGGDANGPVQNVTGRGATASNHAVGLDSAERAVLDGLAKVRAELDAAQLPPAARAEADGAVRAIETQVKEDPGKRDRFSIRGALGFLKGLREPVTIASGLAIAVNALEHAIDTLLR